MGINDPWAAWFSAHVAGDLNRANLGQVGDDDLLVGAAAMDSYPDTVAEQVVRDGVLAVFERHHWCVGRDLPGGPERDCIRGRCHRVQPGAFLS